MADPQSSPNSETLSHRVVNEAAENSQFEFEALSVAANYRREIVGRFAPYLRGRVAEVGAGIGQLSEGLATLESVEAFMAVEPDERFAIEFRKRHPELDLRSCFAAELPSDTRLDGIVSVNVMEHIENDLEEMKVYADLLRERRGAFCMLVPASPFLYSPMDKDFGHFRRYTRRELVGKLESASFRVERCGYFNMIGFFLWLLNFKMLRSREFRTGKVAVFDRHLFPPSMAVEKWLPGPPFGQSLVAIARPYN